MVTFPGTCDFNTSLLDVALRYNGNTSNELADGICTYKGHEVLIKMGSVKLRNRFIEVCDSKIQHVF